MALHLQFAPDKPFTTPQGFQIPDLYLRICQVQHQAEHPVGDHGKGIAQFFLSYYLTAELAKSGAEPLAVPGWLQVLAYCGEVIDVPSSHEGMPDGQAYAGVSKKDFDAVGGYSYGYAFVAKELATLFPDATISQV